MSSSVPPGPPPSIFRRLIYRPGRDPLVFFRDLATRYGDLVHLNLGGEQLYIVGDPQHIKDILVTHSSRFMKGRGLERAKRLLGNGLLTSEGTTHLRQRRLMQPAFHRDRIAGYGATMVAHAERVQSAWADGATIEAAHEMNRLTLSIVGKTLFDADVEAQAPEVRAALTGVMESFWLMMLPYSDVIERLPIPQLRRSRTARAKLDAIIYRMIAERRASGADHGDLLSMLLMAQEGPEGASAEAGAPPSEPEAESLRSRPRDRIAAGVASGSLEPTAPGVGPRRDKESGAPRAIRMSDEQVRDEAMTIFLAGHETTANALTWTWYLLSQAPDVERKLHDELDRVLGDRLPAVEDIPALKFTDQIVTEALRLYPPAWIIGRRALDEYAIGEYRLPARSILVMSPFIVHRDPRFFSEPDRFNPQRWTPEFKAALPPFAYFPFGGGPRRCIGDSFAWMELVLLVSTIARRRRLRLVPGQRVETQAVITLRPKYGMKMTVEAK